MLMTLHPNTDTGMSSLLMQAAHSAAQADGLLPLSSDPQQQARAVRAAGGGLPGAQPGGGGKKKGPPLRRGKWTPEEEAYANRLIQEFKAGLLPLTDGTTLRTFLSKLLNCDPMRISKKFVGSNCIGKQVFRRRTADLNRLTPEQIQQSRAELSELERRFLERVAQTNRVKSSGVGTTGGSSPAPTPSLSAKDESEGPAAIIANITSSSSAANASATANALQQLNQHNLDPPSPPWLQPPNGYKHGMGAAFAAANLMGSANSRAAAAGRALLGGGNLHHHNSNTSGNNNNGSLNSIKSHHSNSSILGASGDSVDLLAELQRRASQQSLLQNMLQQQQQQQQQSANNLLAAAAARSGSAGAFSGMPSFQNSSANHLAGLGSNTSMQNLMIKTALSRDQLSHLARDRGLSSNNSLTNMVQRQNSFDALMSLDFQSLQSIDNLANLIQTGGGGSGMNSVNNIPESGLKNADFGLSSSLAAAAAAASQGDLRRLAAATSGTSTNRMESLLRDLSSNNMSSFNSFQNNNGSAVNLAGTSSGSNNNQAAAAAAAAVSTANFNNLLQSMQGNLNALPGASAASLFGGGGNGQSAVSLANLLRQDSSTGLTALRMQDGLMQRNSSVDDFLSLVAAGDIPHQDPNLLNVPLMQGNPALANALASRANLVGSKRSLEELGEFAAAMQQGSNSNKRQQQQQQHHN